MNMAFLFRSLTRMNRPHELALASYKARRTVHFASPSRACVALICLVLAVLVDPASVSADEDHDHDHDDARPAVASSGGPRRQADGSVFLPASAQEQIGVQTVRVVEAMWPRAFTLTGKIVMDPSAGGRVQAAIAGRLQAGPAGLPSVGQTVKRGEVLAYVVPTFGAMEKANQQAQQAELRAALKIAQHRLERLQALSDTVARKDIEAAHAEAMSLRERLHAVSGGLLQRDVLSAPVTGVIASANATAGQVMQPGDQVFEVIDPKRLHVEALVYDLNQAGQIGSASFALGERRIPLRFIGAARSLREQALPLIFAIEPVSALADATLALGQIVQVTAQAREQQRGIAVPISSLVKNSANQDAVWVKTAPERFEPRVVMHAPLDGSRLRLTLGVKPGESVVTQGATLINQIR